ncbi:hypothetical protein GCM10022297_01760 [Lactobacillus hamsteri]
MVPPKIQASVPSLSNKTYNGAKPNIIFGEKESGSSSNEKLPELGFSL